MPKVKNVAVHTGIPGYNSVVFGTANRDVFLDVEGSIDYFLKGKHDYVLSAGREGSIDFGPAGGTLIMVPTISGIQTVVSYDPGNSFIDFSYNLDVTTRKGAAYFDSDKNGTFGVEDVGLQDFGNGNWRANLTGKDPDHFVRVDIQTAPEVTAEELRASFRVENYLIGVHYEGLMTGNKAMQITGTEFNDVAMASPYQPAVFRTYGGNDIAVGGFEFHKMFLGKGRDWAISLFGPAFIDAGAGRDHYLVRYDKNPKTLYYTPGDEFVFFGTAPHSDFELSVVDDHHLQVFLDGDLAADIVNKPHQAVFTGTIVEEVLASIVLEQTISIEFNLLGSGTFSF